MALLFEEWTLRFPVLYIFIPIHVRWPHNSKSWPSLHFSLPTPPGSYGSLDVWVRQWAEAVCYCHFGIKLEKGKANYPQNQSNEPTQSDELTFQTKKASISDCGLPKYAPNMGEDRTDTNFTSFKQTPEGPSFISCPVFTSQKWNLSYLLNSHKNSLISPL